MVVSSFLRIMEPTPSLPIATRAPEVFLPLGKIVYTFENSTKPFELDGLEDPAIHSTLYHILPL